MGGEYISREAAIKRIKELHFECKDFHLCGGVLLEINALDQLPAADVVEVVRCRDCKNWDTDWVPSYAGKGQYFCPILGQVTDTDFYCGCGKRKDGGQDDV